MSKQAWKFSQRAMKMEIHVYMYIVYCMNFKHSMAIIYLLTENLNCQSRMKLKECILVKACLYIRCCYSMQYSKSNPQGVDDGPSLKKIFKMLGNKLTCKFCEKSIKTAGYYHKHVAWCRSDQVSM